MQSRLVGHSQRFRADSSATVKKNLDIEARIADSDIQRLLSSLAAPQMTVDIMSRLDSTWNECNFSDGSQRIIGLARTLLRDSTVYVMDEPTSRYVSRFDLITAISLMYRLDRMDEQSHVSSMRAIFDVLPNKTVIATTHILVGITMFDHIIVIDDGCLVEQGSPTALLTDGRKQHVKSTSSRRVDPIIYFLLFLFFILFFFTVFPLCLHYIVICFDLIQYVP